MDSALNRLMFPERFFPGKPMLSHLRLKDLSGLMPHPLKHCIQRVQVKELPLFFFWFFFFKIGTCTKLFKNMPSFLILRS